MGFHSFYKRYICLNLEDYSSIGIDLEINKLLIILMVGLIIGTVIINRKRSLIALTVSRLLRHDAVGESEAKNLTSLGICTPAVKKLLSSGGQIRSLVKIADAPLLSYDEYVERMKDKDFDGSTLDLDTCKIYLDHENIDSAKRIASSNTSSPLNTALFCILIVAVFVCLIFMMPEILSSVDKLLSK